MILSSNGDTYFAYINGKSTDHQTDTAIKEQLARARFLLGNDAKRAFLGSIVPLIKEKNAISFKYLHVGETAMEPEGDS